MDEGLDELVELGPEPSPVDEVRVVLGCIGSGRLGRRGRKVRQERGEEGLEREEGLENELGRRGWGDEVEELREVVDVGSGGEEVVA